MSGFWMGHRMLGDVLGFCAAAHLYSAKTGRPVQVWFDPTRKDACRYFDGVEWVPREEIPRAIDCGGNPALAEWPSMNGVKRFYRFMDPALQPTKSFDIHFNRPQPTVVGTARERLIGLITHSNTQGDIDDGTLGEMLAEARRLYPEHKIVLFGNRDNAQVPDGVEDWRQDTGDIGWIIEFVSRLDLLITPQSGPCFAAAGWRVPMWVHRSREAFWDWTLNFDMYKVERWWERRKDYSVFDRLYRSGGWSGMGSGPGSAADSNQEYLWILHKILRYTPSIKTVLDIGCGDWQHMQHADLEGKEYLGVDVSSYVIESNQRRFTRPGVSFRELNPILEDIPQVDLVIIKDVLQHLPNADTAIILKKIRERSRFALITNDYTDVNRGDIAVGEHRPINVLLEPYDHPGLTVYGYIGKQVVLGIQ